MSLAKIIFTGSLLVSALLAGEYSVDRSHSSVAFKVKHMMISNVKGNFDTFDGKFEYDTESNSVKSLEGTIEVDSINTANQKRDAHLKSDDIFSAKKYPLITFKLDSIKGEKAYGRLTMKGVTKPIELEYESGGSALNGHGKKIAAFSLSGKIKRSDYGIKWNKVLEAGGVAVSDSVKLEIEIEGVETKK